MISKLINKTGFSQKPLVLLSLIVFGSINLLIVIINHYSFRTVALDYAIYNFAFFDYAHLRISPCPAYIYPFPASFFQDHFSLSLILLSPLYWLMAPVFGTYALLILQWVFIVAGSWATYKLIETKSGNYKYGLAAMIYYFLLLGRYNAYREDVNLAIIGSSMIPVFLYFFETRRLLPALLCFVFLLVNREDYSLWLVFIGLFLMIRHRKNPLLFKYSVGITLFSALFFVAIFTLIFPAIEDEHKKFALFNYAVVGETPVEALRFVIQHPLKALEFLFINHGDSNYYDGIKQEFYIVYLISGGFILLFRPAYLIPLLPLLAKKMYDDNPLRWGIETYYSIEFVSILPVFVFLILIEWKSVKLKNTLVWFICIATFVVTIIRLFIPSSNPIVGEANKSNFLRPVFYQTGCDVPEINAALNRIPKNAAVCASCRLLPHLAYREKVYYFPRINDANYICLLKRGDAYPLTAAEYDLEWNKLVLNKEWKVLENKADFILLQRNSN